MVKARIKAQNPEANLVSYRQTCESFSWAAAEKEFTWPQTGRLNIVYEAVDRWAEDPQHQDQIALILEKGGGVERFSFAELKARSGQWANFFLEQGLKTGEVFFLFLPAGPEFYWALLACARLGLIFVPLLADLNYDELAVRLEIARPRAILTRPDLVERLPREAMDGVEFVFLSEGPRAGLFEQEVEVAGRPEERPAECEPRWLSRASPLYLVYTSGSTGPPKAVVHAHGDMAGHLVSARYGLDLKPGAVLWTDSAPASVIGTVYQTFAPWLCQAASVIQDEPFLPSTWYRTLERNQVSIWYTSPATLRGLRAAGEDLPGRYDLSALRHLATVGEALVPELFYWVRQALGLSPHDTWWMAETGIICLANFPALDIKPGSMGRPLPGIEAAVLDEGGEPLPFLSLGELALRPGWPGMLTGVWRDEERLGAYFRKGWFVTGDLAVRDEEGYFYHQGRNDDLIKTGEKLIGPFEIEAVLAEHPAVREAAVIARGEPSGRAVIKAFVTLGPGFTPSARLKQQVRHFVKANLSADLPLEEVVFLESLPKTRSGKVLRRVLRARELGLPAGETEGLRED